MDIRVFAVRYTDVGSSGHRWKSVTSSKFTFRARRYETQGPLAPAVQAGEDG